MPYGLIYRMHYQTNSQRFVTVDINKKSTYSPTPVTPEIIDLIGVDVPFKVSAVDNDKNKFNPIRAKEAVISFLSSNNVTARTFALGEDDEWYVTAIEDTTNDVLFQGFLVMDDHQEAFLPVGTYTVQLTATDNLGTLKEVPLTKPDGTIPKDFFKIIEFIAWCLQKTGLQLEIIVTDTWMEESQTTFSPACDVIYLWSKTFEDDKVGTRVNCYRALEIILSKHCFVTQRNGKWWIGAVDEMNGNDTYRFRFDYEGNYIEQLPTLTFSQTIGINQDIKFIQKDCLVSYTRPHKYVKLIYPFDLPIEIIDNINFERGLLENDISADLKYYDIEDWVLRQQNFFGFANDPASNDAYIVRKFLFDYERERYIEIASNEGIYPRNTLRSNGVYVDEKDRFTISFDSRYSSIQVGAQTPCGVELVSDGVSPTYYRLRGDGTWEEMIEPLAPLEDTPQFLGPTWSISDTDVTEWKSTSVTCKPIPVNGTIYIHFFARQTSGVKLNVTNLQFQYIPHINGGYREYSSQYHKVSQSGEYKANVDEEIYISDSPKKLFKGAMFKLVSGKYVLTQRWYAGGEILNSGGTYPIDDAEMNRFGYLQAFAVWNQYNRPFVTLRGSMKGLRLDAADEVPDFIHNYSIDTSIAIPNTDNKNFILAGCEQDTNSDTWNGTLLETFDTTIPKSYSDEHEFKYES